MDEVYLISVDSSVIVPLLIIAAGNTLLLGIGIRAWLDR